MDTRRERLIQSARDDLWEGRTTLVVAHRSSTVHIADKASVFGKGQIVSRDMHRETMAAPAFYYDLVTSQLCRQETSEDGKPRPSRVLPSPA